VWLGGDDVEPDDLPAALSVHRRGDHRGDVDHPPSFTDPLSQGIDPQIPVAAIEGAVPELGHLDVELGRHAGHLRR